VVAYLFLVKIVVQRYLVKKKTLATTMPTVGQLGLNSSMTLFF